MGREILPGQGREPFPLHPDGGLQAGCYKCLLWGVQVGLSFQSLAQDCRTGAARLREGPVLGGKQSLMLSLEHWGRREESTSFQREGPEFRRKSQDSEGQPLKPELMHQFLLDAGGESFPAQHSVSSQIITGFPQVSLLLTFLRELKVSTTEESKSHRETSSKRGERRGGVPSRRSQPGLEKTLCKRQTQVVPGLHPGPCHTPDQGALSPSGHSWPCPLASPEGSSLRSRGQTTTRKLCAASRLWGAWTLQWWSDKDSSSSWHW